MGSTFCSLIGSAIEVHALHYNKIIEFSKQGRNSSVGSVLGSLSCLMQRCGFYPPLRRIFPVEGIFPLGVIMGSDSIPPKNSFG